MKLLFIKSAALIAAITVLAIAPQYAQADQLFTFVSAGSNSQIVNISPNGGASYIDGYSGRYVGEFSSGPTFNIFCVDLNHDVSNGNQFEADTNHLITDPTSPQVGSYYNGGLSSALTSADFNPVLPGANGSTTARASEVAWLADNYLNATSVTFSSDASGSTDLNNNLTGVSLSIWDILQDGGDGIYTGTVTTDATGQSDYGSLVAYYESQAALHENYKSATARWIQAPLGNNDSHYQDFVYEGAVPEPKFPAFLAALGLVAIGIAVRRRRAKTNNMS